MEFPASPCENSDESEMLLARSTGRFRWAVNSTAWNPIGEHEGSEFQYLLSLIREEDERQKVMRFMLLPDKKRALLSRLLVRRASALFLGHTNFSELEIARTKGGKPFLKAPRPSPEHLANFNFNVSHEGDWVVLASEPICVCGVDVAAPRDTRPKRIDIYDVFHDQLTANEWAFVRRAAKKPSAGPGHEPEYEAFQRHWSCKEAFVKARGDGLAFALGRVGFTFAENDEQEASSEQTSEKNRPYWAAAAVDGKHMSNWSFIQHRLGSSHWVTVARAPTSDVQDANGDFKRTMPRTTEQFDTDAWGQELTAESPSFCELPVSFLVPEDNMAGYVDACGK